MTEKTKDDKDAGERRYGTTPTGEEKPVLVMPELVPADWAAKAPEPSEAAKPDPAAKPEGAS